MSNICETTEKVKRIVRDFAECPEIIGRDNQLVLMGFWNPLETVWLQSCDDLKSEMPIAAASYTLDYFAGDRTLRIAQRIHSWNSKGQGIFVAANELNGDVRTAENVGRIRCVVARVDKASLDRGFPIDPTCIVQASPSQYEVYFTLAKNETLADREFQAITSCLIEKYGSDPAVRDKSHLVRLVGTMNHCGEGEPLSVRVVNVTGRLYSAGELSDAFQWNVDEISSDRHESGQGELADKFGIIPSDEEERIRSVAEFDDRRTENDSWKRRERFLKLGQALYSRTRGGEQGQQLWWSLCQEHADLEISRSSARDSWENFSPEADTWSALAAYFEEAQRAGWQDPRSVSLSADPYEINWPDAGDYGNPERRSQDNIRAFLDHFGYEPWKNEFTLEYHIQGFEEFDQLNDEAFRALRLKADACGLKCPREFFEEVVLEVARKKGRHPVKEYLEAARREWDGKPRLENLLPGYAGADDTPLNRAIGYLMLVAAVARIYRPGEKYDYLPVLIGEQGSGKSSFVNILGGEWAEENLQLGADSKTVIEQTNGKWFVEISELAGMGIRDVEIVKGMISRRADTARMAYARSAVTRPRQFVMIGTSNEDQILKDHTGNRRFLLVKVSNTEFEALQRDRDMLWAEAAHYALKGEPLALPSNLYGEAIKLQKAAEIGDPVSDRLEAKLGSMYGLVPREDLWNIVGLPGDKIERRTPQMMNAIGRAMKKLGWESTQRNLDGKKQRVYLKSHPKTGEQPRLYWNAELSDFQVAKTGKWGERLPAPEIADFESEKRRRKRNS